MRKSLILLFFFSLIVFFAFQTSKTETKPQLVGSYYGVDTIASRAYCKGHTLTLKADSTFTFYSMCLNSEGKWAYRNKKVVLNSKPPAALAWYAPKLIKFDSYNSENDDIRVKVIGGNGKPVVCEEIKCVAQGKTYTRFTDKE